MRRSVFSIALLSLAYGGCSSERSLGGLDADTGTPEVPSGAETAGESGSGEASDSAGRLDVSNHDIWSEDESGATMPVCHVPHDPGGDGDGVGSCNRKAPPDSFEPDVQWEFTEIDDLHSYVTPLVGNLNDDNDDGTVDLCDVPDVVLVAREVRDPFNVVSRLFILDGATGALHARSETAVAPGTPALGDIDGDGVMEIVTATCDSQTPDRSFSCQGRIAAFGPDGSRLWVGDEAPAQSYGCHVALADVDNDGDVEILCGERLYDHRGRTVVADTRGGVGKEPNLYNVPALADLDGDGDAEVVWGDLATQHDGSLFWVHMDRLDGYPQIADLDDDGRPEVLVTNTDGLSILEHDGTPKFESLRPTGVEARGLNWARPAAIHDFDGDGQPEFAMSSQTFYTVYEADASILWSAAVADNTGIASGTAFDFLGDGVAEAMYADEDKMFVFDGSGTVLLEAPRTSATITEYPVVADIDNDGSAEILVVSDVPPGPEPEVRGPVIQAIRDVEDRWIQARRIWNQHTYHVTNVREDGSIPQFETPHWERLNTYRTNAQIEGGSVCKPDIPMAG